ncbi:MAG: tyrosine-type recombinase/integrase [Verrucomicrobiales bacterium]|nr:tyrosine-type recombinase/integrase [Verrucomicrobiales bacterium]
MKQRYYLFRRGRVFYFQDGETGRQTSLRTVDRRKAERILLAKNEASEQPALNLSLARAYLTAHNAEMVNRTWEDVMQELASHGVDSTQERSRREFRSAAYDPIRSRRIIETRSEDFLAVLRAGGRATNHYLRRLQNLALGLGWLPWTVLSQSCWPKQPPRPKRGITGEEHKAILAAEAPGERRLYYDFLWETGTSQTDAAKMDAENVDWEQGLLVYFRQKLRGRAAPPAQLVIGPRLAEILEQLPKEGPLFPKIQQLSANHRAAEFNRRCRLLGIKGVSLHSYRYAWAERAMVCGYPERFAQVALGHNSRAVHHAYAKQARVKVPSLEEFAAAASDKVVALPGPRTRQPSGRSDGIDVKSSRGGSDL